MTLLPMLTLLALAGLCPLVSAWHDVHMQFANIGLMRHGFAGDVEVNAGRCLELVPGSNNGESADARLWACRGRFDEHYRNQQVWRTGWSDTEVIAVNYDGVDYCLDVEGGNAFPGARVRFFKCNWTVAQYWRAWADDRGRYRSQLNTDLCLDPAGGWSNDRNGQNLVLWHCHDGGEQKFAARPTGEFRTNLYWDMAKNCHSDDVFFCYFNCQGIGSRTLVNVIFEGVKLACGLARHHPIAFACVSAAVLTQDALPNWDNKCKCHCERWRPQPRPGPSRRAIREPLTIESRVVNKTVSQLDVQVTISGNSSIIVSAADLLRANPHLKAMFSAAPVHAPAVAATKPGHGNSTQAE